MKPQALLCSFVVLMFASAALAGSATVVSIKGDVKIVNAAGKERQASVGDTVQAGGQVRTGDDSTAELKFENGSILRVRPKTAMRLSGNKRQAKKKKNSVVLFFGRLWSSVTGSGGDRSYEVATPNAVCGVRGTEFETAVGDDGSVRVRVSGGTVAVGDGSKEESVGAGQEVEADESGVDDSMTAEEKAKWAMWERRKADRLRKNGKKLVDHAKGKIMDRKAQVEKLRERQKELEAKRKGLEERAQRGDSSALKEIRKVNAELATIADQIADIGDMADSQFGLVDHYADLANDPRFRMIDRKYLVAEAESLRRIRKMFDKMVADGTDISMEAMDKLMDDMGSGRDTGMRDESGSTVKDLFGDDDMDLR